MYLILRELGTTSQNKMLETIQKVIELNNSLVMMLGEGLLVFVGVLIGNGYFKKIIKKGKRSFKMFITKSKKYYRAQIIKIKRQYKRITKKYYQSVIKPVWIGLAMLMLGTMLGNYFQAININKGNLQTTLYQQNKFGGDSKNKDRNSFFIEKAGNIDKGAVRGNNFVQNIDENILRNANVIIQQNILEYDKDTVEMIRGKLRCKTGDNILQWQKNIQKWKCVKPFEVIFGEVSSSVEVNASGTLECDEEGKTLYWDDGQWSCGDVGNNIYTTDGGISGDREVKLNSHSLGFMGGNIGIGDLTPDALLDVAGDFRLDGALLDKDGDTGIAGQVLSSTATGIDWVDNSPIPFISSNVITVSPSVTTTITLEGDNFTDTSAVSIPGFDGTVDSVNVLSPNEMEVTLTTGASETFYDIVVSNDGILNTEWLNNGKDLLEVAGNVTLIPGDGTTNWVKISTNVATTQGKIVPTITASAWNKGAGFGTIPAGKDFLLTFNPAYMSGYSAGGYAMIGVDSSDPNHNYNTIDFALYMQGGSNFMVYENGASRGNYGSWTTSDLLGIRRTGTTIEYLKNGSVLYTSPVASSGALVFDSSLYRYLGAENIKIEYSN